MSLQAILYIEDDDNDVFFMKRAFKQAQVLNPLVMVNDGKEAMDYLAGTGPYTDRARFPMPCLVLLDLNLPIRTGFEVLKWIRSEPNFYTLLVVVLTSSAHSQDIHRGYELGANAYLVKPPTAEKLYEVVQRLRDFWFLSNEMPPDCVKFKTAT